MPENNKKSRSEINFEKRDDFYNKLKSIRFDFDARTLDLKTFKEKFSKQLGILARLCSYTRNNCKGHVTRKYLKLISDSAISSKEIIEKPLKYHERTRYDERGIKKRLIAGSLYVPVSDLCDLNSILIKTSKARFPHLINRSTLDYEFTRDKLHELGTQIPDCIDTMLALSNECEINNLLSRIEYVNRNIPDNELRVNREQDDCNLQYRFGKKLKEEYFQDWAGDPYKVQRISKRLRSFNKIKDFSNQLIALNDISNTLSSNPNYDHNLVCDGCGKTFVSHYSPNHSAHPYRCDHNLCINCIKRMVAAKRYKCPKCGEYVGTTWIWDRIEDGE